MTNTNSVTYTTENEALIALFTQMEEMEKGMLYAREDYIEHELERLGAWG